MQGEIAVAVVVRGADVLSDAVSVVPVLAADTRCVAAWVVPVLAAAAQFAAASGLPALAVEVWNVVVCKGACNFSAAEAVAEAHLCVVQMAAAVCEFSCRPDRRTSIDCHHLQSRPATRMALKILSTRRCSVWDLPGP